MAGEIEFFEPEPERPEHAPRHGIPDRQRGSRRRSELFAGALVAAVVLGGLVARAVTGGSPNAAPSAAATSYVSTPALPSDVTITLSPSTGASAVPEPELCTGPGRPADEAVDCVSAAVCPEASDGLSACTTSGTVPAPVLAAVREQYPGAVLTSTFTEVARETDLIWYRSISFTVDPDVSLMITLEQSGNDPGRSDQRNYSDLVERTRAVHRGSKLNTIVEYSGRFGRRTTVMKLGMLAADSRLASVG